MPLRPLGFMEFFHKTIIIRQLTKGNESKNGVKTRWEFFLQNYNQLAVNKKK